MRLCDHIPYILPLVCFDMSGISCRLLLVPGSFQYLHMKAGIPTERPGGGDSAYERGGDARRKF